MIDSVFSQQKWNFMCHQRSVDISGCVRPDSIAFIPASVSKAMRQLFNPFFIEFRIYVFIFLCFQILLYFLSLSSRLHSNKPDRKQFPSLRRAWHKFQLNKAWFITWRIEITFLCKTNKTFLILNPKLQLFGLSDHPRRAGSKISFPTNNFAGFPVW